MKRYTHILLDADHTIFDFETSQNRSLELAFDKMKIPFRSDYAKAYDRINKSAWLALERGQISRKELVKQRSTQFATVVEHPFDPSVFHDHYKHYLSQQVHYYDHARETVEELSKHYTLAMITNGLAPIQRPRLSISGIEHLFDEITISGEIDRAKPDPEYFNHTFQKLKNPDRKNTLVIGDNLIADIYGGQQAGCDTCWINYSNLEVHEKITPTYSVDNWLDIQALLL